MDNPEPAYTLVEYRVRPVTRFIVTRYEEDKHGSSSEPKGEFDNEGNAYGVAYALCSYEHGKLGWPLDDTRIKYPVQLSASAPTLAEKNEATERALGLRRGLQGPKKRFT
ncbi:hypothetical protein LNAOJCKE_0940 [Methylorubrum aminovorans]|uniref:Uncharacterized protein n=1 Tax=Methylorubrum aminovorans TaxID=269069 RepID=A0ABQ4UBA9_9HYPH|nr:hypothetical protein [Methylorubrum aminovorans]GJE63742.1 hypothetical protein LNAOJCKE_0940 [Methylorubrum aminovorans]GMA73669.1 hypothetical protein GCM10025880_00860 [Methylorubrum aminovorans]